MLRFIFAIHFIAMLTLIDLLANSQRSHRSHERTQLSCRKAKGYSSNALQDLVTNRGRVLRSAMNHYDCQWALKKQMGMHVCVPHYVAGAEVIHIVTGKTYQYDGYTVVNKYQCKEALENAMNQ